MSLITRMTARIEHHIDKTEDVHLPLKWLQEHFLKTTYQPQLAMPKVDAGVTTPATRPPCETDSDGVCRRRCTHRAERHHSPTHTTRSTFPERDKHGNQNSRSQSAPVLKESGLSSQEAEAAGRYRLRYLLKGSCKMKKPKVLLTMNNRYSAPLEYNTYPLIEISQWMIIELPNTSPNGRQGFRVKQKRMHLMLWFGYRKWRTCMQLRWNVIIKVSMRELFCGSSCGLLKRRQQQQYLQHCCWSRNCRTIASKKYWQHIVRW